MKAPTINMPMAMMMAMTKHENLFFRLIGGGGP
jgi:hypothetical protein